MDCPLSPAFLKRHFWPMPKSETDELRLFVLRKEPDKDGHQSEHPLSTKEVTRNHLFEVIDHDADGRLLVFDREITLEETSINFGLDYSVEPFRTTMDVSFANGLVGVCQGADRHPRLFASLGELVAAEPPGSERGLRERWGPNVRSVVRIENPHPIPHEFLWFALYGARGDSDVAPILPTLIFDKTDQTHWLLTYPTCASEVRRFVVTAQSYRTMEYRNVVVRPTGGVGKP